MRRHLLAFYKVAEQHDIAPLLLVTTTATPRTTSIKNESRSARKSFTLSWLTFSSQSRIWSFHAVILQRTTKKCTKNDNPRHSHCTAHLFFSDVSVAVVVVVFLYSLRTLKTKDKTQPYAIPYPYLILLDPILPYPMLLPTLSYPTLTTFRTTTLLSTYYRE